MKLQFMKIYQEHEHNSMNSFPDNKKIILSTTDKYFHSLYIIMYKVNFLKQTTILLVV